jgi:putative spermidine/putrescine transport system permease protein
MPHASRAFRLALYAGGLVIGCFLVLPSVIVASMSFTDSLLLHFPPRGFSTRWYAAFFDDDRWTSSALTSVKVASITMLLATVLGTLTALGLVRGNYRGKAFVTSFVLMPLIVPLIVIAVGMQLTFSGWDLVGTLPGFVVAHTALAMPFVVVTVAAGLRTVDPTLERAARTLGAGPVRTFWRITLPLLLPSVLAGALFAFIVSWDEVVVAIFISSSDVRTLPVLMWGQVHDSIEPTIAAVAAMLTAVTVLLLATVAALRWRASARGLTVG